MRRTWIAAGALVVVGVALQSAGAVCMDETALYVKHGYHCNQQWPWPFVCPDRVAVREPFCIMVNNGWRRQNLLGPHHFNPDTNQLTTAGELRVNWIMTQAPPERRSIFVERVLEADVTTQRLAAAREYATKVATDGRTPQVAETFLISEGRPAAVVDSTNVKFQEAMPAPTLPAATVSTTGQ